MPGMADPNFAHTITYICEHTPEGAMGIVINRPMDISVSEIFDQLNIGDYNREFDDKPVLCGGPVQLERGFVLHPEPGKWDSTLQIDNGVYLSTSKDILEAIAHDNGPTSSVIALGYAGWGEGQLEEELAENAWLSVKAVPDILFDTPYEERWQAAASLLGVDLSLLSMEAGHA